MGVLNSFGDSEERKQARESVKRASLLSNYPPDANAQAPEVADSLEMSVTDDPLVGADDDKF